MATKKKPVAKAQSKKDEAPAQDRKHLAAAALRPSVNAAVVVSAYGSAIGIKDEDISMLMDRLAEDVKDVWAGDMKRAEAMLFGQAHALQAIFMSLARRAQSQEYLKQWEAYLRMALKAQNQSRMTLESLAEIKNPRPVAFVKQANIAHGPQQVNNGTVPQSANSAHSAQAHASAHAGESQSEQSVCKSSAPHEEGQANQRTTSVATELGPNLVPPASPLRRSAVGPPPVIRSACRGSCG